MSASRPVVLLAALTFALAALPSCAAAKGVTSVKMCGASGCADVTDDATNLVLQGGSAADPPSRAAPFYVLHVGIGEPAQGGGEAITHDEFTMLYVPSKQLLRGGDGTWMQAFGNLIAPLDGAVASTRPWPGTRLAKLAPEVKAGPAPAKASGDDGGGFDVAATAIVVAGATVLLGLLATAVLRRRRPEAQA